MKKILICAFLSAAMLFSCMANDGPANTDSENRQNEGINDAQSDDEVSENEARAAVPDELPDMDFGGYKFTISTREEGQGSC